MAGQLSSPTAIHPALGEELTPIAPSGLLPTTLPQPIADRPAGRRPSSSYTPPTSSATFFSSSTPAHLTSPPAHLDAHPPSADPIARDPPHSARAAQFSSTFDAVPHQTIIKALASVARQHKPEALSLSGILNASMQAPQQQAALAASPLLPDQTASAESQPPATAQTPGTANTLTVPATATTATTATTTTATMAATAAAAAAATSSSQQLCDALSSLALRNANGTPTTVADAAALAGLKSPCFYHQRFDDAVDIDKVLEEIKNDEYMSHSRLVQTATGVREVSKQLQRRPIRRAVRNIMVVTKARDNQLVVLTRELAQWLLATPRYGSPVGVNVYVDAKLRNSKRFDAPSIVAADPRFESMLRYWTPDLCWSQPEKFDLVITLGGDGTVLFTSWLFQRIVPPVLSFSLGSLGFLTTFEFERFRHHLDRIMGNEGMRVNLRMRFTCTVYRDGCATSGVSSSSSGRSTTPVGNQQPLEECEQFEVLNELVIDRGPSPYVSNLELYGDDELLTVVQADGCIFSTPTGSTAYSLSAGGSLVHPDIPAILLTPICPHTLSFRPMVLSDTMLLRVSIPRNSRATAYCAFDGKGRLELKPGDCVTITASQYPFPTVTRTDNEWFDSVSRTLRWNTRAAMQKGFDAGTGDAAAGDGNAAGKDEVDWDIDTDSAYYASEEGSVAASPLRRQMSLLGM